MRDFNATLRSIVNVNEVNIASFFKTYPELLNVKIKHYLLILYSIRYIGLFISTSFALLVSYITTNKSLSIILSFIIFLLPVFLYINGFTFILNVSVFDVIAGNLFIKEVYSIKKLIIYIFLSTLSMLYLVFKTKD